MEHVVKCNRIRYMKQTHFKQTWLVSGFPKQNRRVK